RSNALAVQRPRSGWHVGRQRADIYESERWPSGRRRWTGIPVTSSRVFVGSNPTLSARNKNAPRVGALLFLVEVGLQNPRVGSTKRQDSRFAQLRCPKGEAHGCAECNPTLSARNKKGPQLRALFISAEGGTENPRVGSTKRQDSRFVQLRCPKGEARYDTLVGSSSVAARSCELSSVGTDVLCRSIIRRTRGPSGPW